MGHHNHHFSGDPHALSGVWGPPTSAANFCEEDYAVTRYAAEFINTVTNLAYIYLALRHPRRPSGGIRANSPDALSLILLGLGITSAIFHATLRQGPQLCDELSMLAVTTALVLPLYTRGRSPGAARLIAGLVVSATSAASAVYVRSGDILYHVYIFSATLALIWPRTLYLIYQRPPGQRRRHVRRFGKAVVYLLGGYAIWNVDLEMCLQLRELRSRLGLPWAWLLECHGWWHILTALGASEYNQLVRELCLL